MVKEEWVILAGLVIGIIVAMTGVFNLRAILTRVFTPFLLWFFVWLIAHFVLFTIDYLPLLIIMAGACFCIGYLSGLIITYLYRYFKIKNSAINQ